MLKWGRLSDVSCQQGGHGVDMDMDLWNDENVRKLIQLVRSNPGLFAKGVKMYKDQAAKQLAWETIGANLLQQCSGDAASKKFKNLRDVFVKEHRAVKRLEECPSGSAGGAMPTRQASEYYYDLLFLAEHVGAPRTSASNIKRPRLMSDSSPRLSPSQGSVLIGPDTPCMWAGEGDPLTKKPMQDVIFCLESEVLPSSSQVSNVVASHTGTAFSTPVTTVSDGSAASTDEVTSDSLMSPPHRAPPLSTRQKAAASLLRTPSPDIRSGKAKEKRVGQIKETMETFHRTADKILERIGNDSVASSSPFSDTLVFAMHRVPEDRKVECLLVMLQVANSFAQGKTPKVSED